MKPVPLRVIAHRGASAYAPENTAAAVDLALAQGADAIECDVQWTRDREVIVLHDPDLHRIGGAATPVSTLPARDVLGHPVHLPGRTGHPACILTLEDWLSRIPPSCLAVVELKDQGDPERNVQFSHAVCDRLRAREEAAALISFELEIVTAAARALPGLRSGPIRSRKIDARGERTLLAAAHGCVVLKKTLLDPRRLHVFLQAGQECWSYALDTEDEILAATNAGVNGIITNRPDVAVRVLRTAGSLRRKP